MTIYYADYDLATGANDGSSASDAFQTFQDVLDAVDATTIVGGDEVLATGTDSVSTAPSIGTLIDPVNPITFKGRNSSFVDDGSFVVIDAGSTVIHCFQTSSASSGFVFYNHDFRNSTLEHVYPQAGAMNYLTFINCKFINAGSWALRNMNYLNFINCYFSGTSAGEATACTYVSFIKCFCIAGSYVHWQANNVVIVDCIVHDYAYCVRSGAHNVVVNTIIDECSTFAINIDANQDLINLRLTNNAIALNAPSADASIYSNTFFYNPTGSDISGADSGNLYDVGYNRLTGVNLSDGYTDRSAHDFSLSGDGVFVPIAIGTKDDTSGNSAYITQGLSPEGSGGGGLKFHPGMDGGLRG